MEHSPIDTAAAVAASLALSCDLATLSAAVDFLAKRVTERRATIPILGCILARADIAGTLQLEATDLDVSASVTIPVRVESPGVMAIDADALQATLAKARKGRQVDAEVRISDDGGRAGVKIGRNRTALATRPANDWPMIALSDECDPIAFALPAARFVADLAAVGSCASREEARYYLNGAAMQVRTLAGQDRLCLVATDGGSIAVASRPCPIEAIRLEDVILPSKAMAVIGHAAKMAGDVGAVQVGAYPARPDKCAKLTFELGNVRIVAKMIDGIFPDWQAPFADPLAAGDASPALFPELLPGAPVASIDKIAKAAKGVVIDWQPARDGLIGTVAGDDGLLFGALNMADATTCQRKGFDYQWEGEAEAKAYLVALAESRGLLDAATLRGRCSRINTDWRRRDARLTGEHSSWCDYQLEAPHGYAGCVTTRLVTRGTQIVGLTVEAVEIGSGWTERRMDWERLAEVEIVHERRTDPIEGSYSILMPADGPGQLASASAIEGPDGVEYPVAMSDAAIHLSKEQVRALIGESCFETIAVDMPGLGTVHFAKWLWEQGDSRLVIVQPDGRCFRVPSRTFARAEIEAAMAGEAVQIDDNYSGFNSEPVAVIPEQAEAAEPVAVASQPSEAVGRADSVAPDSGGEADAPSEALSALKPEYHRLQNTSPEETAELLYAKHGKRIDVPAPVTEESRDYDLTARLAEIEARLAAIEGGLSVERVATPIVGAKRTAAHERAVRRAWAERKARRTAMGNREFAELGERVAKQRLKEAIAEGNSRVAAAEHQTRMARQAACEHADRVAMLAVKRRRSTILARQRGGQMAALAGMVKRGAAELAQVKRSMVDPAMPERSSDIARLVSERDAARTANAALQARAERSEAAALACAEAIEALASRVARAEAAVRAAAA